MQAAGIQWSDPDCSQLCVSERREGGEGGREGGKEGGREGGREGRREGVAIAASHCVQYPTQNLNILYYQYCIV